MTEREFNERLRGFKVEIEMIMEARKEYYSDKKWLRVIAYDKESERFFTYADSCEHYKKEGNAVSISHYYPDYKMRWEDIGSYQDFYGNNAKNI